MKKKRDTNIHRWAKSLGIRAHSTADRTWVFDPKLGITPVEIRAWSFRDPIDNCWLGACESDESAMGWLAGVETGKKLQRRHG